MTRERTIEQLKLMLRCPEDNLDDEDREAVEVCIEALEQEPCDDCISREEALQALCKAVHKNDDTIPCPNQRVSCLWNKTKVQDYAEEILKLPSVTPQQRTGYCKDCKWWKDSDGIYRRGVGAESQCPINRKEVFEGTGYCYMFEPKVQEVEE